MFLVCSSCGLVFLQGESCVTVSRFLPGRGGGEGMGDTERAGRIYLPCASSKTCALRSDWIIRHY